MPARPTDRAPISAVEKLSERLNKVVKQSVILQPVNDGVNQLARKLIFRALTHIQFGSLTLIEAFGKKAPPKVALVT